MKSHTTKLTLLALAMLAPMLQAQRFAPLVAVKGGVIRNWQQRAFNSLPTYSFYPEIELEHKLFALGHDSLLFSLAAYGGFWDDGVETSAFACGDCFTYSTSEKILGVRLGLLMAEFPVLPLGFYGGIARRCIAFEYVAGFGINGEIGHDYELKFHDWEAGVFVQPRLFRRWHLLIEIQHIFPRDDDDYRAIPAGRWVFKLGLVFHLGK